MINEVTSRNELADILNVPRKRLTYLLYVKGMENLYSAFDIPKKNGEFRYISAPNRELKIIQRRLANELWRYEVEIRRTNNCITSVSYAFEKGKIFLQMQKSIRIRDLFLIWI